MKKTMVAVGAAVSVFLGTVTGHSQQISGNYRSVERGHTVRVIGFFSLDPNCQPLGRFTINLLTPPRGGSLKVGEGPVFPKYPATNIRSACNKRRVSATNIYYNASSSFTGDDSFSVESVSPTGEAVQSQWTVHVE